MPTISGDEKTNLINLFNQRKVKFYHACQLQDFEAYIELGGIPSRNLMQNSDVAFTAFDTDDADQENEVWNLVFGNLQDSGKFFAKFAFSENTAPTPNAFGPILIQFSPDVFTEADDVAICLRSAGGRNFNRNIEALPNIQEVNKIFVNEDVADVTEAEAYKLAFVKYINALRIRFNNQDAATPEVSCTVENELISFNHIFGITVDPYVINGEALFEVVCRKKNENGINGWIVPRNYNDGRFALIQELATLLVDNQVTIEEIIANNQNSIELRDWASRLERGNRQFHFNRFAQYLRNGTILRLQDLGDIEPDIFDTSTW